MREIEREIEIEIERDRERDRERMRERERDREVITGFLKKLPILTFCEKITNQKGYLVYQYAKVTDL